MHSFARQSMLSYTFASETQKQDLFLYWISNIWLEAAPSQGLLTPYELYIATTDFFFLPQKNTFYNSWLIASVQNIFFEYHSCLVYIWIMLSIDIVSRGISFQNLNKMFKNTTLIFSKLNGIRKRCSEEKRNAMFPSGNMWLLY